MKFSVSLNSAPWLGNHSQICCKLPPLPHATGIEPPNPALNSADGPLSIFLACAFCLARRLDLCVGVCAYLNCFPSLLISRLTSERKHILTSFLFSRKHGTSTKSNLASNTHLCLSSLWLSSLSSPLNLSVSCLCSLSPRVPLTPSLSLRTTAWWTVIRRIPRRVWTRFWPTSLWWAPQAQPLLWCDKDGFHTGEKIQTKY